VSDPTNREQNPDGPSVSDSAQPQQTTIPPPRALNFQVSEPFVDEQAEDNDDRGNRSWIQWLKRRMRKRKKDELDVYPLW
jgi:hypothetical protein